MVVCQPQVLLFLVIDAFFELRLSLVAYHAALSVLCPFRSVQIDCILDQGKFSFQIVSFYLKID